MLKWCWAILGICLICSQATLATNAKVADLALYLSTKVDSEHAAALRRVAELGYAEESPMKTWQMLQNDFKKITDSSLIKRLPAKQQQFFQKFFPKVMKMMNQYLAAEIIIRSKNPDESKALSKELAPDAAEWRAGLAEMMTEMLKYKDLFPPEDGVAVDPKAEAEDNKNALALTCAEFGLSYSEAWTAVGSQTIGLTFFRQAYADTQTITDLDLKRQYLQKIGLYAIVFDPKVSKTAFELAQKCYSKDDPAEMDEAKEFQKTADFICSLMRLGISGKFDDLTQKPFDFTKNETTPARIKISEEDLAKLTQEIKSRAESDNDIDLTMAMAALAALKAADKTKEALEIADSMLDNVKKSGNDEMQLVLILLSYNLDEVYFREKSKSWLETGFDLGDMDKVTVAIRGYLDPAARYFEGKQLFDEELTTWTRDKIKEKGGSFEDQTLELSLLGNITSKTLKTDIDAEVDQRLKTWVKDNPKELDTGYAFLISTNAGIDNARAKMFIDKFLPKSGKLSDEKKDLVDQLCQALAKTITNPIKSLDPLDMGF